MNFQVKKIVVGVVILGLTYPVVSQTADAATAKANGSCAKAGQKATAGTHSLVCTKSGKKLVWKVAPVATTKPAPASTAPAVTAAPAASAASAPASTAPVAAQGDIVVGGIFSRTGVSPFPAGYESMDSYFKELNANGGINGRKIKFIGVDDGTDTQKNAVAMKRLIESEKAVIVLETAETGIVGGIPIARDAKVPIIGCYSQPLCFNEETVFPVGGFYQNSLANLVTDLLVQNNNKKIAMMTIQAPTALIALDSYKKYAAAKGVAIVSDQQYAPSETDFTAYAAKMIASGTSVIDCLCSFGHIVAIVNSLKQQGYNGDFFAPSFDGTYPDRIGPYANGRFYMSSTEGGIGAGAAGEKMQAIMKKYYPDANSEFFGALQSWTNAELFTEAVNRLGNKPVTSASLIDSLNTFKEVNTTYAPPITYGAGPHKDPAHCLQMLIVTGGKFFSATGARFFCYSGSVAP